MQKFKTVEKLINQLKPNEPIYCIRKKSIQLSSKFFLNKFPGDVLYAVKTNPHPLVLKTIFAKKKLLFQVKASTTLTCLITVQHDYYFLGKIPSLHALLGST